MISIVIPVYNHSKELKKCLKSILRQTYQNYEVIIVDDGSDRDNPKEVVKEFCQKHPQIKVKFISQENKGASSARNRGAKEAQGSYLIFLDADTIMKKEMLEKMLYVLKNHPQASYVYSSFKFGWKKFKCGPFDVDKLRKVNFITTNSMMKRKDFPGFDESLKKFQDWDLWLTMLEQGHIGVWYPQVLFKIKPRKHGMSKWFPKIFFRIPWKKIGIRIKELEEYEKAKKIIFQKHRINFS